MTALIVLAITGLALLGAYAASGRRSDSTAPKPVASTDLEMMQQLAAVLGFTSADVELGKLDRGLSILIEGRGRGVVAELVKLSLPSSGPSPLQAGYEIHHVSVSLDFSKQATAFLASRRYEYHTIDYRHFALFGYDPVEDQEETLPPSHSLGQAPPWKVLPEDLSVTEELLRRSGLSLHVHVANGPLGESLELVSDPTHPETSEPLCILSRGWDKDSQTLAAMAMVAPSLAAVASSVLTTHGYEKMAAVDNFMAMYHKR